MQNFSSAVRGCLILLFLLMGLPSIAQQQPAQIHQTTEGACSPAIIDNNGRIVINCGVANEEVVGLLNKLLARESSKDELLSSLNKVRSLLQKMDKGSDDPRKELVRLGLSWTNDSFGETVLRGDMRALKLFFAGGMSPYTPYQNGHAIAHLIWGGKNADYAPEVLELFIKNGLDVDKKFKFPGKRNEETGEPLSLAEHAIEAHNANVFKVIWNASRARSKISDYLKRQIDLRYFVGIIFTEDVAWAKMLLIAEPDAPFKVFPRGFGFNPSPEGTWYMEPKATHLVKNFTYEVSGRKETTPNGHSQIRLGRDKLQVSVQIEAIDLLDRKLGPAMVEIDLAQVGRNWVKKKLTQSGDSLWRGSVADSLILLQLHAENGPLPGQMRVNLQELLTYAAAIQSVSIEVFQGGALVKRVPIDFKHPSDEAVVRNGGIFSFQDNGWYALPQGEVLIIEITLLDGTRMNCKYGPVDQELFLLEKPPCMQRGGE